MPGRRLFSSRTWKTSLPSSQLIETRISWFYFQFNVMNMRNWHKEKNQRKRKSQFSWGDVSWWQLNVEEIRLDRWFGSKVEWFSMLMDWWLWGQTQLSWNQEVGCKDSCCEYCDSWPAWESGDADICRLRRDELRGLSNSTSTFLWPTRSEWN